MSKSVDGAPHLQPCKVLPCYPPRTTIALRFRLCKGGYPPIVARFPGVPSLERPSRLWPPRRGAVPVPSRRVSFLGMFRRNSPAPFLLPPGSSGVSVLRNRELTQDAEMKSSASETLARTRARTGFERERGLICSANNDRVIASLRIPYCVVCGYDGTRTMHRPGRQESCRYMTIYDVIACRSYFKGGFQSRYGSGERRCCEVRISHEWCWRCTFGGRPDVHQSLYSYSMTGDLTLEQVGDVCVEASRRRICLYLFKIPVNTPANTRTSRIYFTLYE